MIRIRATPLERCHTVAELCQEPSRFAGMWFRSESGDVLLFVQGSMMKEGVAVSPSTITIFRNDTENPVTVTTSARLLHVLPPPDGHFFQMKAPLVYITGTQDD